MAEKEGAIVKKGHEEGLKMALSLLEEYELPAGLLPLADVIEVWIKKLKGVKAKELMLWPPVGDIAVDLATGKIHFKSLAGITKTFPVEAFAAGQ
ncbi:hypothetical protein RND71_039104 [Anisodus tanguticus]|uniref:Uncharacterized protein n=1 Tax=Anisodus tanguticus TaxID=243964 RepID=A0AAE1QW13_9SOLA|nr:hypothetical protein RND71_039104 [Anisodus tanguticus]